jgi:hypothetical protein
LWDRFHIPVYFYEAAAMRPGRVNLANIRRGQFEGLREEALHNPERSPDIGGPSLHPTAGATAVGVRKFLIAYNIYLNTDDVFVAREIARAIRSSSGGLPCVKAMGAAIKSRGLAQVSINLTDFEVTPLHAVFEAVKREAERRGCAVAGSEIIGLIPLRAIDLSTEDYLLLEHFSPQQVLENRLAAVAGILPAPPDDRAQPPATLQPQVDNLREAVEQFSERALETSEESRPTPPTAHNRGPEQAAQAHLDVASAAAEIYERLVQLEPRFTPSMMLEWVAVKQAALAAARASLESAEALFPSLRDASTVARIKTAKAEIEGKLSGKQPTAGN